MVSPRWRKVWGDIRNHKSRTVLVVLSIVVGIAAIGLVAGTQAILAHDLTASYAAIRPADAFLYTAPFDEALVQSVRNMREIQDAEGRGETRVRLQVEPERWLDLNLVALADYADIRISQVRPVIGAWPPARREVLIERAAIDMTGAQVGDSVVVETGDGKRRSLAIAGLAHDANQAAARFQGAIFGYVTFETLEWLGGQRQYTVLHIRVAENQQDKAHIQAVANQVRDKIEKSGRTVHWVRVSEPGAHPAEAIINPMFLLLGVLGALSLLLSGFLVVNTISALLAQQIRQIGVMKAIGARSGQIAALYLVMVMAFGVLALAVAAPLGALGARAVAGFMAAMLNFDITSAGLSPQVFGLELALAFAVPLAAAAYPVVMGTRVSVREAIGEYGLGKGRFGTGRFDRLLGRVRGLDRPLLISLRNTFRRKGRLALTLATLVLGSAIFMGVFSVRASLLRTLDDALAYWNYDAEVSFNRWYRADYIERQALQVPGVAAAECWAAQTARRIRPDDSESGNLVLIAPPAATELLQPTVVAGRWLLAEDENALVINTNILQDEPDLAVGDEIVLQLDGSESTWRIVGVVRAVLTGPIAYANQPYFTQVTRNVGRASGVQIVAENPDPAAHARLAQDLKAHFEGLGLQVSSTTTTAQMREQIVYQFNVLVAFLAIMAVLLAVVGGLGLMGTMSMNVLERRREIGVMRAIGASNGAVFRIVVVEGMVIGAVSWLLGVVAALPISQLLSDAVGQQLLQAELSYTFSIGGAAAWLLVVLLIAMLSSLLPARAAARLTVRETLGYE